MLDKLAVARALREIGLLLQAQGENPFKVRAYETGARALEDSQEDLPALVSSGRLTELRGIGEALAKKISELHLTGRTALLERLRTELPPGLLELLQVPDLGPKKVAALREALGVGSVAELEAACRAGRVRGVKGFGEKTEQRLLEALARFRGREARLLLSDALELGERLVRHLRAGPDERVDLAGSARRRKETVGDLDLVASAPGPADFAGRLTAFPLAAEVVARGETKTVVRLASGVQVDLRVVAPEDHAAALHHATGSKGHHVRLRGLARDRGYSLSEYGLAALDGGAPIRVASEEELYARLGLPFIPPELREDAGELEAALSGALPTDLVRQEDVRGLVHCHTRWSDGRATLEEMAAAADALGMEYLTITDHSPSAHYAGGLTVDRLRAQWDELARVQESVRVKLLRGTESDITEDGLLDFPDAVLEQLDVIVASVHTRFKMDEAAMTRRLRRAMELPVFKIWGHARGRLLLEREPFECRMEEVLDALAGARGAVEVNGDPHRLELEPRFLRLATERGIPVVLSVDAHSTAAFGYLRFAVDTARRGWIRRGQVLNALPAEAFARAVRPA
ncbi:DNA polymerase/3'-5' exonuclease PolX [Anaeromyxobacter diazotrophicus]|uniref:DNA polymerase beta n=1 Tax=Anaeromyxobacter diazotrophicus TaxID=2590199 RepID=A0A7I9VNB3_9BACT|nr:DNA polymerase/3'-5' exonuclease PolX [Anaeromyxobacter diazotrophicus]GEJ57904.1 DNA polymerase/3'-5' exonuclease PolX [Anaeromyxobacter diazotrophicus]